MHKKSFTFGLGLGLILISIVFFTANFFENIALKTALHEEQQDSPTPPPTLPEVVFEELTDDEIIKKASDLGMVFVSDTVAEQGNSDAENSNYVDDNDTQNDDLGNDDSENDDLENTDSENIDSENTDSEDTDSGNDDSGAIDSGNDGSEDETSTESSEYTEFVKIRITGGMSAVSISRLLERNGVISDANDFLDFLAGKRATTLLGAGELVFPLNADYDDVLNVLRKSVRYSLD